MSSLEPPDSFHFRAAQGWLELGNAEEAAKEIEAVSPNHRSHPDVLEVRWHISAAARSWDHCVEVAGEIIQLAPDRVDGWIHRSFALHELKRTQEALDRLLPVVGLFPESWTIPYNLACYCAQLGRLAESRDWLKKALGINEEAVKGAAADDPDLKPLWEEMGGTLWAREQ